jgi:phosphate-selective porin OprO and OprP
MTRIAAVLVAILLIAKAGYAQPDEKKSPTYDAIWKNFTEIYDDSSNRIVQKVLFTGRLQVDYASLHADQGDHDEWNVRRLRLGPKITFLKRFTLHAEVELNPQERNPTYQRFTDFYVQWSRSGKLVATVGKHGVPFTMDGATSSKELLTIDRSNLANNIWFPQEYIPGVSVNGKINRWTYRVAAHSGGAMDREFGRFNGGVFTLASAGYDFAKPLAAKDALLTANYVYQPPDRNNTFTRQLHHIASVNFRFERERWGARTDVSLASGYLGQSDMWGVMLMPFVNVTTRVQIVGRYTALDSELPNGVRLATYENTIVPGRGDRYNEGYVGANYFFYGHKLKLQTGLQFAGMRDSANDGGAYSGVSWTTGLRLGW